MVEITIEGDKAVFHVQAMHQLWAMRSRLEIPLAHIVEVHVEPNPAMGWFDGFKMMGTDLPHLFRAGMFYLHGQTVFYDVRHPEKTIVVVLEHEFYKQLIIETADPEAAVQLLKEHLPQP